MNLHSEFNVSGSRESNNLALVALSLCLFLTKKLIYGILREEFNKNYLQSKNINFYFRFVLKSHFYIRIIQVLVFTSISTNRHTIGIIL